MTRARQFFIVSPKWKLPSAPEDERDGTLRVRVAPNHLMGVSAAARWDAGDGIHSVGSPRGERGVYITYAAYFSRGWKLANVDAPKVAHSRDFSPETILTMDVARGQTVGHA